MKTNAFRRRPHLRFPVAALSLCLLLAFPAAHADTTTTAWQGDTSTTWGTNTNWAGDVLPSTTVSAKFDSTFTNQPQLTTSPATQGIWLATGVGQDVVIGKDGSARTITITGNATLNNQTNAGILLDDSGNHNLTLGDASANNYVITLTNSTGFYVNNAGTLTLTGLSNLGIGNGNTLTLGGNNTAGKIVVSKGIATSTGAIVVDTAGTVTLNNQNSYTGGTTLTAGTLNLGNAKALGNVTPGTFTINGGTIDNTSGGNLTIGNSLPINIGGDFAFKGTNNLNMGLGTVNLNGGTRTITTTSGTLTIGTTISNGGITKAGGGTLALSGNNSYSSDTTVSAGTLLLGAAGSISSSPLVDIKAGATFDTSSQNFSMLSGQTFKFTLDSSGSGSAGFLNAAALNITVGVVDFATVGSLNDSAYIIAHYTSLTGSAFATVTNTPAGYTLDYNYLGGNNIALVVPEPATWGLLAFSLTTVLILRRRRNS